MERVQAPGPANVHSACKFHCTLATPPSRLPQGTARCARREAPQRGARSHRPGGLEVLAVDAPGSAAVDKQALASGFGRTSSMATYASASTVEGAATGSGAIPQEQCAQGHSFVPEPEPWSSSEPSASEAKLQPEVVQSASSAEEDADSAAEGVRCCCQCNRACKT